MYYLINEATCINIDDIYMYEQANYGYGKVTWEIAFQIIDHVLVFVNHHYVVLEIRLDYYYCKTGLIFSFTVACSHNKVRSHISFQQKVIAYVRLN